MNTFDRFINESYKNIFIDYCVIGFIKFPENSQTIYSVLSDKIIQEEDVKIFKLNFDNHGLNIYYKNKLIETFRGLVKEDLDDLRDTFLSANPNFGKKYFEKLIRNNICDKSFIEQIGHSLIESPNIQINDIIRMFGMSIMENSEFQLIHGYNNFTVEEISKYSDYIDWIILLTGTNLSVDNIIKKFRYKIYDFFNQNISADFVIQTKYLNYLRACCKNSDWIKTKYIMSNFNFDNLPYSDVANVFSGETKFPYQYYYQALVKRNFDIFRRFGSNFSEDFFYTNNHIPSEIIQILIDEHFENPYFRDTLGKLDFEGLENLTFPQIILLHKFGFLNYHEIKFSTTSFGAYQMKKYKDDVGENLDLANILIPKIFNSDNGREEFEIDKKLEYMAVRKIQKWWKKVY